MGQHAADVAVLLQARRVGVVRGLDFERLLQTGSIYPEPRFGTVGLDDQQKRFAQLGTALIERASTRDGAGDFFDPADE